MFILPVYFRRSVLDAAVFDQDADLRYTWMYQPQSGYAADQVLGKTDADLLPPEAARQATAIKRRALESGLPARGEVTVQLDDRTLYYDLLVEPLTDSDGRIVGITGASLDITERWHVDQALRQRKAELNEAQRIAKIGSWTLDLVTDQLTWSDETFRIFEIDPTQFLASYEAFLNLVHPEDREAVNTVYTRSLETRQPYEIMHRLLMPDGRIKYVHGQCETQYDASGRPVRSIGIAQDVTQRRQAEIALRESEARNRAILSAVPDLLFRVSTGGVLLDYHASDNARFLIQPETLIDKRVEDVLPPDLAGSVRQAIEEALRSDKLVEFECDLEIDGKRRCFEARSVALSDDEALVIVRDITESKVAKDALKRSAEQLRLLSQKLIQAQEDERRRIGHELHDEIGQLLTGLKLSIGMLGRQLPAEAQEPSRQALDIVDAMQQRLRDLSRNLMPPMLETLGLAPALELLFRQVNTMMGITIHWERHGLHLPCPCPWEVRVAAYRIVQEALTNVVRHSGAKEANVETIFSDQQLFITVEDRGCGFALSDPRSYESIGLGGIMERVRALGGDCEIVSEIDRGTFIWVNLPCDNGALAGTSHSVSDDWGTEEFGEGHLS
jgi:PAS domain S-box-containing protein